MSTTPRTDAQAGWAIANQYGQSTGSGLLGDPDGVFVHAIFARTLERELATEREKVRLLRDTLERRHTEQGYHRQYVDDALTATEEASK